MENCAKILYAKSTNFSFNYLGHYTFTAKDYEKSVSIFDDRGSVGFSSLVSIKSWTRLFLCFLQKKRAKLAPSLSPAFEIALIH